MNKKWMVAASLCAAMTSSVVMAQGPGGPGGGRNSPKRKLGGLVRNIGELEKSKTGALTKPQAKTVVGLINPWKVKPKMTDDDAKALFIKVNAALTAKQKAELDKAAAMERHFGPGDRGSGGGPGGGGPGGPGGPGGAGGGPGGGAPDAARMKEFQAMREKMGGFFKMYNPFYPPTKYKEFKDLPERMQKSFTDRYTKRIDVLNKLAKKAK